MGLGAHLRTGDSVSAALVPRVVPFREGRAGQRTPPMAAWMVRDSLRRVAADVSTGAVVCGRAGGGGPSGAATD